MDEEFDRSKYESYPRLPDVAVDELGRSARYKCDGPEKLEDVDTVWRKKAPELYVGCKPRVDRKEAIDKEAKKYAMRLEANRVAAAFRSFADNPISWPASAAPPALLPALASAPALMPAPAMSMASADSFVITSPEGYWDENKDEGGDAEGEHNWSHLSSGLPPVLAPAPTPTDAAPGAGLSVNLMLPAPIPSPSVVACGDQYQDVDDDDDDDAEGESEDDTSHLFAGLPPAPGPARGLAPIPTPSQTAPAFVPASSVIAVGEQYQDDDDDDDRDDTSDNDEDTEVEHEDDNTHLVIGLPPAPAALPAPAPNPGVPAAAAATAIRLASTRFPAGFELWQTTYRKRNKSFLVGPNYTGGPIQLPPKNFEFQYTLDDDPKQQGGCRWCGCSNWLWDPYFFMRTTNPDGRHETCNRCVFRSVTTKETRPQQLNAWLVTNQPVMFWLAKGDF